MHVVEHVGDLFEAQPEGERRVVIGHGVNCVGVMGAGVAKEVASRYPDVYVDYKDLCDIGWLTPGKASFHSVGRGKWVANLATQRVPGPYAQVGWVVSSLVTLAVTMSNIDLFDSYKVVISRLGCGIGGLDWKDVRPAIEAAGWEDFTVHVYSLEK